MTPEPQRKRDRRQAFTLVEILVSTAIVMGIALLAGRMLNDVASATTHAGKLIDSDNEVRFVFSRMAGDFAAIHRRPDLNVHFQNQAGNDAFYFFSQVPGHPASGSAAAPTGESLVGYRMAANPEQVELERLALGLNWAESSAGEAAAGRASSRLHLPYYISEAYSETIESPYNNSTHPNGSTPSQWDVVGSQVFRFEFCFHLKDGQFSEVPVVAVSGLTNNLSATRAPGSADDSGVGFATGSRWYDTTTGVAYQCAAATPGAATWEPLGLADVNAVVVTLALLPPKARTLMQPQELRRLAEELPDFSGNDPVSAIWMNKAKDVAALASATGARQNALNSIRVYERYFYLD